jgi:AAA15 family ATPase/GTPase
MLVSFSVANILSFKSNQTLRMEAVSHGKDDINPQNTSAVAEGAQERLLKSALLFGANASGKSNFIHAFALFRDILLRSQAVLDESASPVRQVTPFLLATRNLQQPSVLEVVFYEAGIRYRYGLELQTGRVVGEWLFYTPKARETLLFNREGQQVDFNKVGFAEAIPFVKNGLVQQTRDNVPFVSVLASHNGTHCLNLVNWANRLAVISGTAEHGYMGFTIKLMKQDPKFKAWLLSILNNFQIDDINVVEVETPEVNLQLTEGQTDLQELLSTFNRFSKNKKSLELVVSKKITDDEEGLSVDFPLAFESEGTRKLIHLLGPIYDSIKNKRILIIDEVEAKFHSLLTRFLFSMYHHKNDAGGQIIAAAHDTSLMNTQDFRRDQIWFIDKNPQGCSEIYSLVEFKEKARQLKQQYGPDYLAGVFGAVSLFENFAQIDAVM